MFQKAVCGPDRVAQLVGTSSHTLKGCGFDSWTGHTPRFRV